jgi:hypothetical protein
MDIRNIIPGDKINKFGSRNAEGGCVRLRWPCIKTIEFLNSSFDIRQSSFHQLNPGIFSPPVSLPISELAIS